MSDRVGGKLRRRRRSWYRRRLRIQRGLAFAIMVAAIAFVCWQNAARFLSLPKVHSAQFLPDSFAARANLRQELAWTPPHANQRPKYVARIPGMYPYSVVPGGVGDVDSLRRAAASDRAVARHYAHFNYERARLVRLTEARQVYVSYRIHDAIFWTRKKIHLRAGELLLTDGKITARTKCGNQVSDKANPEVSEEEPEEDVLDTPVAVDPIGPAPARAMLRAPELPTGQPLAPTFTGGFVFPIVPIGGVPPVVCKNGDDDKKCHHHHKPPGVPEPSTMVLLASGLGVVLLRYRSRLSKGEVAV